MIHTKARSQIKHILRSFPWLLLCVGLIASAASSLLALRTNYLGASPYIEAVFKADQENGNIEKALYELRTYTYSHMNVDLQAVSGAKPPIQLKHRYEQLVEAEKKRVMLTNDVVVRQGENLCGQQFPDHAQRISKTQCVQNYVLENGTKEQVVPDALYKFDFISPKWSPDLAGWSIVCFIICLFVILFRTILWLAIRRR